MLYVVSLCVCVLNYSSEVKFGQANLYRVYYREVNSFAIKSFVNDSASIRH